MRPYLASFAQLAGLAAFTAGATLEHGWAGLCAAGGLAVVYVGLAAERN